MGVWREEGCHMSQQGALYFSLKSWVIERWNIEPIDGWKVSNGQRPWYPETGLWHSKAPFSLSILETVSRDPSWGRNKEQEGLTCSCSQVKDHTGVEFLKQPSCGENWPLYTQTTIIHQTLCFPHSVFGVICWLFNILRAVLLIHFVVVVVVVALFGREPVILLFTSHFVNLEYLCMIHSSKNSE